MPEHIIKRSGVKNGTAYALSSGQKVSAAGRTKINGTVGDTTVSLGVTIDPALLRSLAESQGVRDGDAVVNHAGLPAPLRGNTKIIVDVCLASMKGTERRNVRRWMRKNDGIEWSHSTSIMGVETLTVVMTVTEYNRMRVPARGPVVRWRDDARSGAFRSAHHIIGKRRGKRRASRGVKPPKPGLGSLRTPRS